MASRPEQAHTSDATSKLALARGLTTSLEDVMHLDQEQEPPSQQQGSLTVSSPQKKQDGTDQQCAPQVPAVDFTTSKDTMLLERPPALLRAPDLERGFQYGPAVRLAPDHFTRIPGRPALFHQEQHSKPVDAAPATSSTGEHSHTRTHLAPLHTGKGTTVLARKLSPNLSERHQVLSRITEVVQEVVNGNDQPPGALEEKKNPRRARTPPFPDSPKRPAEVAIHEKATSARSKSVSSLSECQVRTPASPPKPVDETASTSIPAPQSPHMAEGLHEQQEGQHARSSVLSQQVTNTVPSARGDARKNPCSTLPATRGSRHSLTQPTHQPRGQVNRPARNTPQSKTMRHGYQMRPESRSSNVSKHRSRCGSMASSPMLRQRRVTLSHEFTTGLADAINEFTQQQGDALEEQKAKYHKYIRRLKRDLEGSAEVIARQSSQLDAQSNEIRDLQASRQATTDQLQRMEAKLVASEDRAQRLEEKYRVFRTHLNAAIQEQQDLYARSRTQCGETIEQMRTWEKTQNTEAEMAVQRAEAIRNQMTEKLRQTLAQNKSEALELYAKMDALTHDVKEKETELQRERDSVRALSEELQKVKTTAAGFETIAAQGREIVAKLSEQQATTEEQSQKFAEQFWNRLDAVASRLDSLASIASGQPDVLAAIQESQRVSFDSSTTKLVDILKSQDASGKSVTQLSANLELHMERMWQRLDGQLESLTKQLAEKAEENGMVSTLYRRKEAECEEHLKELATLRETVEEQKQQIQELDASLYALETARDKDEEKIRQLEASSGETGRLRDELKSKAAAVAELQSALEARERAHNSELQGHISEVCKLAHTIQQREKSLPIAIQQAAEAARRETQLEMERANAETGERLQKTQEERDNLANRLQQLEQMLREKENKESQDAVTIRSLQDGLAAATKRGQEVVQDFSRRSAAQEKMEAELTSRIAGLEEDLKTSKHWAQEFERQWQRESFRFESVSWALKQWAQQEGLNIDDLNDAFGDNSSAEEIRGRIIRKLEGLSSSWRSQMLAAEKTRSTRPHGETPGLLSGEVDWFVQKDSDACKEFGHPTKNDMSGSPGDGADGNESAADGLEKPAHPLSYAATLHQMRRVVVRSPANFPSEPVPPSIAQEKARRRGGLQPRSIMKRVTRSTANMMKQQEPDDATGHGAFKRGRQDEDLSLELSADKGVDGEPRDSEERQVSRMQGTEERSGQSSGRQSKRRRLETKKYDRSEAGPGSSNQGETRETRAVGLDEEPKHESHESLEQKQPSGTSKRKPRSTKSASAQSSQKNAETASRRLQRIPAANTPQALGARQSNVRTYGSQRAALGEPSIAAAGTGKAMANGRNSILSQPQSRYWSELKEESQELKTLSHVDENLLGCL